MPATDRLTITITRQEHATILAALRYWEAYALRDGIADVEYEFHEVATDGGKFDLLDADQIDDLAERINTEAEDAPPSASDARTYEDGLHVALEVCQSLRAEPSSVAAARIAKLLVAHLTNAAAPAPTPAVR